MAEITMPKLSDTMTEGTLVAWKKKAGDKVSSGDVIAEVETDKATMEMESFEDGVLAEIYIQEGQKVAVGEKIARVQGKGDATAAPAAGNGKTADKQPVPVAEKAAAQAGTNVAPATASGPQATKFPEAAPTAAGLPVGRIKASPLAKKTAAAQNVSLSGLTGSGPGGRIIQRDVLGAAPSSGGQAATSPGKTAVATAAPAPTAPVAAAPAAAPAKKPGLPQKETRVALSGMRKTIADRLLQSKTTIPHFYLHIEVDAEPMAKLRAQVNAAGEKEGVKISVNDFILKAVTKALTLVPKVNASFAGDSVVEFSSVNLAVAVAVDDGLITPVVKNAESKVTHGDQFGSQGPCRPRAFQETEAGRIPGRNFYSVKPRFVRDRPLRRDHQPAPGSHFVRGRDRQKARGQPGGRDRRGPADRPRLELRSPRGGRSVGRAIPRRTAPPAGVAVAAPAVKPVSIRPAGFRKFCQRISYSQVREGAVACP